MLSFSVYFEPHLRRPVSQPSPAPFLGFPNLLTFKPSNVQTFGSFPPSLSSHQISAARLFSFTYELPILYLLCFDIHPCNGGVYPPPSFPTCKRSDVQTFKRSMSFIFISLRTVLRNGRRSTPVESTSSTHFDRHGGCTPLPTFQRFNVERSEHTCPTVPLRYPRRTLS
jgi:hypothetical protein